MKKKQEKPSKAGAHTPEPWELDPAVDEAILANGPAMDNVLEVAVVSNCGKATQSNRRRIVACINACAGIPTEALEQRTVHKMITASVEEAFKGAAHKKGR